MGHQTTIIDKLEEKAGQSNSNLRQRAATVVSRITSRSRIDLPGNNSVRNFAQKMGRLADARIARPSDDLWLPPSVKSEVAVIEHFNNLLHGGSVHAGVIVDPWFGAHALRQFAIRMSSKDVSLTIVTSWLASDPDSRESSVPENSIENIKQTLSEISRFINPPLRIVNLQNNQRQAFHDRYLWLQYHDGSEKIFLLSNSLNRSAGDWPFCMSLLAPDVNRQVRAYIEGLCQGRDVTGRTAPTISFRWPDGG